VADIEGLRGLRTNMECAGGPTTRWLRRFCAAIEYGADVVVHSMTKFIGAAAPASAE